MNIYKKIISTICASVFVFSCFGFNANAKVIEPEIVKTETWTTSYFIDDDIDTLYPYIQCEADIYNDGTIKLYMWNTHEWDGFATVSHQITLVCPTNIVKNNSLVYSEKYGDIDFVVIGNELTDAKTVGPRYYSVSNNKINTNKPLAKSVLDKYDISYIPSVYGVYTYELGDILSENHMQISVLRMQTGISGYYSDICMSTYTMPLSTMNYGYSKPRNAILVTKPTVDPTGTYNFRLFGHDITITPELLSGNIVAEPELTEQEKYIKQLEEENSKLKTEIESYKKLDFDGNGLLTNADAQMILVYYTDSLVGKTTGKVEDYSEYVKQISG